MQKKRAFLAFSLVTVEIGIQYGKVYFVRNSAEKDETVNVKRSKKLRE